MLIAYLFIHTSLAFQFNSIQNLYEQECIPVGCVPSAAVAVSSEGVSCLGGVCLPKGVSALDGVCLGEVFAQRGVCLGTGVCQTPPQ